MSDYRPNAHKDDYVSTLEDVYNASAYLEANKGGGLGERDIRNWYSTVEEVFADDPKSFMEWEKDNPVWATRFHALAHKREPNASKWGGEYDHKTRGRQLGYGISQERGFGKDGKENGRSIATDYDTYGDINSEWGPGDFFKIGNAAKHTDGFVDFIEDNPWEVAGIVGVGILAPAVIGAVAPQLHAVTSGAISGALTGGTSGAIQGGDLGDILSGAALGGILGAGGGWLENTFFPGEAPPAGTTGGSGGGSAWGGTGSGMPDGALSLDNISVAADGLPIGIVDDLADPSLLSEIMGNIPGIVEAGPGLSGAFGDAYDGWSGAPSYDEAGIVYDHVTPAPVETPPQEEQPQEDTGGGGGGSPDPIPQDPSQGTPSPFEPTGDWLEPNHEAVRGYEPDGYHTNPDGSVVAYNELGEIWQVRGPRGNQDLSTNYMLATGLRADGIGTRLPSTTDPTWSNPPTSGTGGGSGSGQGPGSGSGTGGGNGSGDGPGDGAGPGTGTPVARGLMDASQSRPPIPLMSTPVVRRIASEGLLMNMLKG